MDIILPLLLQILFGVLVGAALVGLSVYIGTRVLGRKKSSLPEPKDASGGQTVYGGSSGVL